MPSKASAHLEQVKDASPRAVESMIMDSQHEAEDTEFWLNDRSNRIDRILEKGMAVGPAVFVLNKAYRAAAGIAAITQILNNDILARGCAQPHLNDCLVGGLLTAANFLAENIEDTIGDLAESIEEKDQGASHE